MIALDNHPSGRHFLQIPGPSPVPDRILRAMSLPTIDHRGPEFAALGLKVTAGIKRIFKTQHPVIIYPSSGTGAWEAALVNLLSPGDHVVMYETGQFAALWARLAKRLGLSAEILEWQGDDSDLPEAPGWRHGVQAAMIQERLEQDKDTGVKELAIKSLGLIGDARPTRLYLDAIPIRPLRVYAMEALAKIKEVGVLRPHKELFDRLRTDRDGLVAYNAGMIADKLEAITSAESQPPEEDIEND